MRVNLLQQKALVVWRTEPRLLKACLVFLGLNLVMLLLGSQWISPKILDAEREMIRLQAEVRGSGSGGAVTSPQGLYKRAGDDLEKVYELIPGREKLSDLVLDISSLAQSAGFEIEHVSYKPEQIDEVDLLGYTLSFKVNGSYRQLKKFIHLLETSSRIIILDSIGLAGSGNSGGRTSLNLTLTTYFQRREGA